MRTLLLLRHAKSDWDDPAMADHDRPLAPRGVEAAHRMAEHLEARNVRPQLVLCSTAGRARETLDLVRPGLGDAAEVQLREEIYNASAEELLGTVRRVDDTVTSVMLVGHNPGLQDLVLLLAGTGPDLPAGALVTLELEVLEPGAATLAGVVRPRDLP